MQQSADYSGEIDEKIDEKNNKLWQSQRPPPRENKHNNQPNQRRATTWNECGWRGEEEHKLTTQQSIGMMMFVLFYFVCYCTVILYVIH